MTYGDRFGILLGGRNWLWEISDPALPRRTYLGLLAVGTLVWRKTVKRVPQVLERAQTAVDTVLAACERWPMPTLFLEGLQLCESNTGSNQNVNSLATSQKKH